MKSGSFSSYRAAGAFGPEDGDDTPIADAHLIRHWWSVYRLCLDKPCDYTAFDKELGEITKELERRNIIRPGIPMPREGAEDIARDCDERKRKMNGPQW